jgi:hypothetical protein
MAFLLLSQAAVGWRQAQYLKLEAAAVNLRAAPGIVSPPEEKAAL